jgi:branched-chain amino acid transport system permease protein
MKNHWATVAFVLLLAIVPTAAFSGYHLFQLTMVTVYAVAILGMAILVGFNGQISLGSGAFYAIGAYTTAILMTWTAPGWVNHIPLSGVVCFVGAGWPCGAMSYWATIPVAGVICAGFGFLIGLPALRLAGHHLALTTFALAVAVPQVLKYKLFEDYTGGVQGLVIDKPDAPFGLPLTSDQWLYLFSLGVAVLMYVLAWNLVRGRIGRAMKAIRDHATAAEAMGINLAMVKTRTFAVSAMYTGIAGSVGAIVVAFVAPDSFSVFLSITLFVGLCAGGAASIPGTIVGAIFIEFVPNVAEQVSKAAPGAIYGVILIAMLFLMPMGAGGFLARLWRQSVGSRGRLASGAQPMTLGHEATVPADLARPLARAERMPVGRGEGVKP